MSRPAHVPPELAGGPFLASDVVARGLLTAKQLRSSAWVRLLKNVYAPRSLELDDATRVKALEFVGDPHSAVCGLTAAWLYGVWKPRPGTLVPLETTRHVNAPGTAVDGYLRRRLVLRREDDVVVRDRAELRTLPPEADVVRLDELRVTSPLRTCLDLVRRHALVEAVAFADAFAYAGLLTVDQLGRYCAGFPRWPAIRQARFVAELASDRARSPGETRLRMVIVLTGLGEPLVNPGLHDAHDTHVATPDLLLLGPTPLAMEYQGGYHDEGDQPELDRHRRTRLLSSTGLQLVEFDRQDVLTRRDFIVDTVERRTGRRALAAPEPRDFFRGPVRWIP